MKYSFLVVATMLLLSCKKNAADETTVCLNSCTQSKIETALASPKGTLFSQIDAYKYNGTIVYLYYAGCCDRYNTLTDGDCNYMFAPSGGFSGGGDGTHPNFFKEATFVTTVWTDPR